MSFFLEAAYGLGGVIPHVQGPVRHDTTRLGVPKS